MLRRLFGGKKLAEPDAMAPGCTLYAIGDIHGRIDLLDKMLALIDADVVATNPTDPVAVFLGDYVDRGEESAQVLRKLDGIWRNGESGAHFLRGNHEEAMLKFIDSPTRESQWLRFGGLQTLVSFGVDPATERSSEDELCRAAAALERALGPVRDFLDHGCTLTKRFGNVFLCHAAVNPNKPLDEQSRRSLLWGNPIFMDRGGPEGVWIVHGHVIAPEPTFGRYRLGVDTGAYYSGKLTAARIADGEETRFLQT